MNGRKYKESINCPVSKFEDAKKVEISSHLPRNHPQSIRQAKETPKRLQQYTCDLCPFLFAKKQILRISPANLYKFIIITRFVFFFKRNIYKNEEK